MGKLAGSLGESEDKTKKAFDVAGSALLGGLMKQMSSPQGAKNAFDEISRFDPGVLGNITQMLTGGGSKDNNSALTSMGTKMIGSLLGSNQNSIISMIARLTGISEGTAKSLLTMLAPLFMGTIAKQVKSGGLNMSALTDLVMGQKAHVAKHLPGDFTKTLGIADLLTDGSKKVAEGAKRAGAAATETAAAGSGLMKMLIPLVILAALAFFAWRMLNSNKVEQVANKSLEVAQSAADATADAVDATAGAVDAAAGQVADAASNLSVNMPNIPGFDFSAISTDFSSGFGKLTDSITAISDEASAQSAIPQIEELTKKIAAYGFDKMPAEGTAVLQGILRPLIEKLKAAIETASKIPGVNAILEPTVGELMKSVSAFI
jgi:hypothetical protein